MKRIIIQTHKFSDTLDNLIKGNKISKDDFSDFEKELVANPEEGDLIQGTGGLRKTRLKSTSKGKSGGFRVCYCDVKDKGKLFLIVLYGKNEKEDLSAEEKQILKRIVERLKGE